MKKSLRLALTSIALTTVWCPVPASASTSPLQQPGLTPEGAQTFFSRLASQGMLKLDRAWRMTMFVSNNNSCPSGCPVNEAQVVQVVRTEPASRKTKLIHNTPVMERGGYYLEYHPASPPAELQIDWARVTAVQRRGVAVILVGSWPDGLGNPYVMLDTEELAVRVQRAAEFLRASCDPTRDTGF